MTWTINSAIFQVENCDYTPCQGLECKTCTLAWEYLKRIIKHQHPQGETMLTLEQQATNYETIKHIQLVQKHLHEVVRQLLDRGEHHDLSKLDTPEVEAFTEHTPRLRGLTFGSPEYFANLKEFQPTLDHHYANNRHHPQHFKNGINDMTLVDLIEMFCDWNASSKRHADGNLRKSIEVNADRFGISPQLKQILENSIELFDK